ncbi:MAG: class I SAM-dependent methyltransferase [Dehalococcoidia bacterium]|nr:class I SAM-dependent methyltransferase [Dehalococcoidia bacterium]
MLTVNFKLFKIENGDRFLDVGCGEGRHSFEAFRLGSHMVCALDMDDVSLRKTHYVLHYMDTQRVSNGSWNVMFADALSLPFKDASFDKIICSEVLEHVADDERGIRELVRTLKRGGVLAVTVPTYLSEAVYWALDEDYYNHPGGHVRKYKAQELMDSLRRNDLAIYAIRYEHAFHSIYWLLRCIFGLKKEKARVPAFYYKFLVLQIVTKSRFAQRMERICNFFFPKSIVIYTRKI